MDGRYSRQKMVLGTHTSEGEQNYLMLAEVCLHSCHSCAPPCRKLTAHCRCQRQEHSTRTGNCSLQVHLPLADTDVDPSRYDEETNEVGGFGAAAGKVQVNEEVLRKRARGYSLCIC